MDESDLIVVGGGLAGSEAAWQAAQRGLRVHLYEMRPSLTTGAHSGGSLAELVCSNSLGSNQVNRAAGLLKEELRRLNSLLIQIADRTTVPAGGALAVDRDEFASMVTKQIASHPKIRTIREEVTEIPAGLTVIASGPLTSPKLSAALRKLTGSEHLFFYDAIAPIIEYESVNMEIAYRASRYERGEQDTGDYLNCPLNETEYNTFVDELIRAERITLREFEVEIENGVTGGAERYFEGCLPVEILARRGRQTLAFGPMRPTGLPNPHTGRRTYAAVQLRQDNLAGTLYNLVGFQTNLTFPEQKRVFRLIPGLEKAEFMRYGQMHRNTFLFSPELMLPTMQCKLRSDLFFAGQITGVEGYVGNMATGALAGINAARVYHGERPIELPASTMIGALCRYVTQASRADFQPMKANFGLLLAAPEQAVGSDFEVAVGQKRKRPGKSERGAMLAERAIKDLEQALAACEENRQLP